MSATTKVKACFTVSETPIHGTHLHPCHEGKREIRPEYRGVNGIEEARQEAQALGIKCFTYGGHIYEQLCGRWFLLVLD